MSPQIDGGAPDESHGADHSHSHGRAPADSAGQPWKGRSFEPNRHVSDDGSAPQLLVEAIARFHAREVNETEVVDAFRESRFLIPLVAQAGDVGHTEEGLQVDKTQELSIVTVTGPDGRNVLPVFSSVDAMRHWNDQARPVPADGVRVALAAASEHTDIVVIDPTSRTEFALRRPAVWAVAQSQPWVPSYLDETVQRAFEASIATELSVLSVGLTPGDPSSRLAGPELRVELELMQGLTKAELDATLQRLASRWAADDVIATRVDSLAVKLVSSADS